MQHLSKYGPIEGIILLGGGYLLRQICLWALSEKITIKVITAPRHASEISENETLSAFFKRHTINFTVIEKITDHRVIDFVGDTENWFCLSLGAAWIFQETSISRLFKNKLFNLHGTRLPQNRGGGGFSWQIMMGNKFGFCMLHRVDGGIDTGDIIAIEEFLYPHTARKPIDFEKHYVEKNLTFVIKFIEKYRSQSMELSGIRQSEYFSTYWPRLNTDINGWIDWSLEPTEIERFICAFDDPYPGAQTYLNENPVHLKSVGLSSQDGVFHSYQTGIIYRKGHNWLCVALKNATLIVEQLLDENGTSVFDTVKVGDRFITPHSVLYAATSRPIYTSKGIKTYAI